MISNATLWISQFSYYNEGNGLTAIYLFFSHFKENDSAIFYILLAHNFKALNNFYVYFIRYICLHFFTK